MHNILTGISNANNFLLKEQNIQQALDFCVRTLGENLGVDRCYVFQNKIDTDGILKLYYEHEWCKNGTTPYIGSPELNGYPYESFPGLYEALVLDQTMYGLVEEAENEFFKEILTMQGILSYLFAPIFSNGFFWGWIGFDDCTFARRWKPEEVDAIHTVAKNIGLRLNQDNLFFDLKNTLFEMDFYMKSSGQAKWEYNVKKNITSFSYNWYGMLGLKDKELPETYDTWQNLLHPEDKHEITQKFQDYLSGRIQDYSGVTRLLHKSGEYIWVKYSGLAIKDSKNEIEKIIGTHIDVTDILNKEKQIEIQRNEYDFLVNNLAEVIFKIDELGNIKYLNKQWEKITGFNIEESLEQPIANFLKDDFQQFDVAKILNGSSNMVLESKLSRKSTFPIWTLVILSLNIDSTTGKKVIMGSITDINDKIEFENKLKISEKKYRFIAENTTDLICQHQLDGTYLYISKSAESIIGYDSKELVGKNPFTFFHPEDVNLVKDFMLEITDIDKVYSIIYRFLKKDQTYVWLETFAKLIVDSNNQLVGIQSSSRDISERIKAEEEVKQALQKERELNELKSGFVTMASHQFRTPLSVIFSNTELIDFKAELLPTNQRNEFKLISERIQLEVDRMTELMNNILVFGKYDSREIKVVKKPLDLYHYINKLNEIYYSNQKDGRKLKISFNGNLKTFVSDESLLTHILTNMINNAFKYSEGKPSPELKIKFHDNQIEFEVKDYGVGVPKDELPNLFHSFYRASNTTNIKGSGLGLVIAKQFTELLNGKIFAESVEFKGATFTIEFPYE
jgi:PAS domain S-box-containing protein